MALSDEDVQKQIACMMAFIEQEAIEKVEEIESKAEEEFNIEKGRLVQDQRMKIMEFFDKKEKQVELQKKIQSSNMLNQARLKVLKAREDHIRDVMDEARSMLHQRARDPTQYGTLLRSLILQGLYQLTEDDVLLQCRSEDSRKIESLLPDIIKQYKQDVGKPCRVSINKESHLPPESSGGVELLAQKGKIKINNTLDSRLEMISQQLLPEIRELLFGGNINRKFND